MNWPYPRLARSSSRTQAMLYNSPSTVASRERLGAVLGGVGGDPSLVVADDADFTNVLTRQATNGGEGYSFTAGASQRFYLGVFPAAASTTDFQIFVTTP